MENLSLINSSITGSNRVKAYPHTIQLSKRLDAIMRDTKTADQAPLLLLEMKKYINLRFNNEV
ncbi:hypothetical protein BGZ74_005043, partial [Mortierella antarctica]